MLPELFGVVMELRYLFRVVVLVLILNINSEGFKLQPRKITKLFHKSALNVREASRSNKLSFNDDLPKLSLSVPGSTIENEDIDWIISQGPKGVQFKSEVISSTDGSQTPSIAFLSFSNCTDLYLAFDSIFNLRINKSRVNFAMIRYPTDEVIKEYVFHAADTLSEQNTASKQLSDPVSDLFCESDLVFLKYLDTFCPLNPWILFNRLDCVSFYDRFRDDFNYRQFSKVRYCEFDNRKEIWIAKCYGFYDTLMMVLKLRSLGYKAGISFQFSPLCARVYRDFIPVFCNYTVVESHTSISQPDPAPSGVLFHPSFSSFLSFSPPKEDSELASGSESKRVSGSVNAGGAEISRVHVNTIFSGSAFSRKPMDVKARNMPKVVFHDMSNKKEIPLSNQVTSRNPMLKQAENNGSSRLNFTASSKLTYQRVQFSPNNSSAVRTISIPQFFLPTNTAAQRKVSNSTERVPLLYTERSKLSLSSSPLNASIPSLSEEKVFDDTASVAAQLSNTLAIAPQVPIQSSSVYYVLSIRQISPLCTAEVLRKITSVLLNGQFVRSIKCLHGQSGCLMEAQILLPDLESLVNAFNRLQRMKLFGKRPKLYMFHNKKLVNRRNRMSLVSRTTKQQQQQQRREEEEENNEEPLLELKLVGSLSSVKLEDMSARVAPLLQGLHYQLHCHKDTSKNFSHFSLVFDSFDDCVYGMCVIASDPYLKTLLVVYNKAKSSSISDNNSTKV